MALAMAIAMVVDSTANGKPGLGEDKQLLWAIRAAHVQFVNKINR